MPLRDLRGKKYFLLSTVYRLLYSAFCVLFFVTCSRAARPLRPNIFMPHNYDTYYLLRELRVLRGSKYFFLPIGCHRHVYCLLYSEFRILCSVFCHLLSRSASSYTLLPLCPCVFPAVLVSIKSDIADITWSQAQSFAKARFERSFKPRTPLTKTLLFPLCSLCPLWPKNFFAYNTDIHYLLRELRALRGSKYFFLYSAF